MIKRLVRGLLRLLYRVEVKGLEHYHAAGERVLIVANHTSFLDGILMVAFFPGRISFAVNTHIARAWHVRLARSIVNFFVMDPTNPLSLKSLIRYVQQDHKVVIFPEGRITVTGALMKIYNGPGMVADRAQAPILPVRIDGAQFTPFSRLRGRVRLRWFPKITLTVLPPRRIQAPAEVRGRERRKFAGKALSDIMTEMMFQTSDYRHTLFEAVVNAMAVHGADHRIVEDIERQPLTYRQLLRRAFILGEAIQSDSTPGENVGVLLPNTVPTVITLLGLHIHGRVPAMLNYTLGFKGFKSACDTACIRTVYTSRRFIRYARLENVAEQLAASVKVVYLEDVVKTIGWLAKFKGIIHAQFPVSSYRRKSNNANAQAPAVVLFTSGSEGSPKGVVLSHVNILANGTQLTTRIDFNGQDIIFNALPMFHSFGLTAGTLLPLVGGMRAFFYPSPLHYRIVPEMAYAVNATIMFGTNTFLNGYARFAHPYDFYSMRYVFAGAEKLQEQTRRIWSERFGLRIFEGYGATETAPVIATNTAMENKPGTVGQLLPGMGYRIEPVEGVEEGGRLLVQGPNVMSGYLLAEQPGVLRPPKIKGEAGWYDTGDIVAVDEEGFLRILGRAKRFAKIGGEMVSLASVEELVAQVWPSYGHAVITQPDPQKGEQLVLVTENPQAQRRELLECARSKGYGELQVPRRIVTTGRLPLLGTGKTDYAAVHTLVEQPSQMN